MKRRILGIALAVVLALAGTIALVLYVQAARDDAAAPEPTSSVLVVDRTVRQGAGMAEISERVVPVEVPTRLVADGAVSDVGSLPAEYVAGVELRPGEQLLRSRLVAPSSLVRVEVPVGLQEVTVALEPERAVGGNLEPGSTVGVVLSFEPFELSALGAQQPTDATEPTDAASAIPRRTPNTTHLTLHGVLVTSVQLSRQDAERVTETRTVSDDADDQPAIDATIAESPRDRLLVTLAVSSPEVEQVVFAAEFGRIWLTLQDVDTDTEDTRILTLDQVYVTVPR